MELINTTPFSAERVVLQDKAGRDLLVVIVKSTFTVDARGRLQPSEKQVPIQMADAFYGDPGESSVRYESDLALRKIGTDVVLVGHAFAPKGKATQIDVTLKVGPLQTVVRVFGDRRWDKVVGLSRITPSQPFEKLPLVYERAFGGKDLSPSDPKRHEFESRNPIGRGFAAKKSKRNIEEIVLPNLEDPAHLIKDVDDRPEPVGFGFIGRHWQPRVSYVGTYDEAWKKNRCPLLPDDFDERYFNGAHPRLVSKRPLQGNEPVEVIGASPHGPLRFTLPGTKPNASVLFGEERVSLELSFDTLVIEPDESRLTMVWRGSWDVYNQLYKVKKIEIAA